MKTLNQLIDRVIHYVDVNLSEFDFHSDNYILNALKQDKLLTTPASYGMTYSHPSYFHFRHSNISGSCFLGKCYVEKSAVYKSNIFGDELKKKGDLGCRDNLLLKDEMIAIRNSVLYKSLVHSSSNNPETPEEFCIRNTVSSHYTNIHGSTLEGCFLGPLTTVNHTNLYACMIGEYSYLQTDDLFHKKIDPGTVWFKGLDFEFYFRFREDELRPYIHLDPKDQPCGKIYDHIKKFEKKYNAAHNDLDKKGLKSADTSVINRYSLIFGDTEIGEKAYVAHKAILVDARVGDRVMAKENTYTVNSVLSSGCTVSHGSIILNSKIGSETIIGFNVFMNGNPDARIKIGKNCIVLPHTIIDPKESAKSFQIPDNCLVWGKIRSDSDLLNQSIPLNKISDIHDQIYIGEMIFKGDGNAFIKDLKKRFDQSPRTMKPVFSKNLKSSKDQSAIFCTLQPYSITNRKGLYPSIKIK